MAKVISFGNILNTAVEYNNYVNNPYPYNVGLLIMTLSIWKDVWKEYSYLFYLFR